MLEAYDCSREKLHLVVTPTFIRLVTQRGRSTGALGLPVKEPCYGLLDLQLRAVGSSTLEAGKLEYDSPPTPKPGEEGTPA